MSVERPAFLPLWTLAVAAAASAFVVHLALRSKSMQLGYELGHAQQEGSRLCEVKRVLEVEAASYKTPERVEIVARTLLGMEPPPSRRIIAVSGVSTAMDSADRSEAVPRSGAGADAVPWEGRRLATSSEGR